MVRKSRRSGFDHLKGGYLARYPRVIGAHPGDDGDEKPDVPGIEVHVVANPLEKGLVDMGVGVDEARQDAAVRPVDHLFGAAKIGAAGNRAASPAQVADPGGPAARFANNGRDLPVLDPDRAAMKYLVFAVHGDEAAILYEYVEHLTSLRFSFLSSSQPRRRLCACAFAPAARPRGHGARSYPFW